ncbi:MAG TPA: sigma-70 family RNA polymerase sigma factor [Bacteroidales bacterium]|nr:sigma-70 family RNA polymerase sigma factor [Bacteroidales bacterium]HPT02971.1 sigma-70 family RNA polymerase sigma factor [Bacteroidales bacterium]
MIHYSDEAIVEGLRLRSDYIITFVYREYFPLIKYLVNENSGADEDAEDIFQDGLIIIYKKITDNQLTLTSSFKTYMYSVCRNLWLQKLNKRKTVMEKISDVEEYIDLPEDIMHEISNEEIELHRLVQLHFLSLNEDCQKILRLFMKDVSLREIGNIMGFKTEKYAKTRKYMCKEELKKRIANDPRCQKFFND